LLADTLEHVRGSSVTAELQHIDLTHVLPTSGGRSVGIVRSRTQTMEFFVISSTYPGSTFIRYFSTDRGTNMAIQPFLLS
jgi:hypothetical protein